MLDFKIDLYGLSTLIDDNIFGDLNAFRSQFNSIGGASKLKMSLIMVFLWGQTMLSQTLAKPLLATSAIGVTQLKRNPSAAIREAGDTPVAILQHNTPAAYLISAARYEAMLDVLDDVALRPLILDRQKEISQALTQDIDELEKQAKTELAASKKKSRQRLA